jgi:hypothetical protein
MKRTAFGLVLGTTLIASVVCFQAGAEPQGLPFPPPPPGAVHMGLLMGPPPGPPLLGPDFFTPLGWSPELIESVKLTDDQLKQMRLTFVNFKEKTRKTRIAVMVLNDEKYTMLISGKLDPTKLAKIDEDSVLLASEVMTEYRKMSRDQISKLTPEQLEHLADFLVKRPHPHGPKMPTR